MWGFDVRMPHETIIGVGLIIREDQNNIGCFSCANKYKEQVDKEEGFFHKLQVCLFIDFSTEGRQKSKCQYLIFSYRKVSGQPISLGKNKL
jgi:hypothetical protein